ncbi:putative ATP-dependent RNA helicase TDRD12 [Cloeon dipterum]|uniref:putative ATP-dependent RNA helicase TDRD12 n=1 Tax=Cloeon dipterum TaxID=197152 RepID=UPI0032208189
MHQVKDIAQYRDSLTNFTITVGEIVNPALFWGYKSCRDNQDLIALETKLSNAFRDAEPAPFPTLGCLVAVEHPKRKEWVRARICEIGHFEHDFLTAKVFLVDYGNYLSDVRVMHSLPAWALKMWPQAYLFQLRGIIPAELQFDENMNKQVLRKSNNWVLAAEDKVRGLLRKGPCKFSWNQGQQMHAIGDVFLYIENNVRTESLSKYLTQCQYAVFDSEQFHKELVVEAVVAIANLREGFLGPDIIPVFPASPQVNESIANLHINGEKSLVSNGAVQHSEMPSSPRATNPGHPVPVNSPGEQQRLRAALQAYSNNQKESQNVESGGSDIWSTSKARKKREAEKEAERLNMNIDESQLSKQLSNMKFGDDSESAEKRLSNLLVNMKSPHLPVLVLNFQQEKPLTLLSSAPFLTDIIRVLEKAGFVTPTNIQKYMWPSICRGRSVIAVGALDTGKTMGFLAPLASILLDQCRGKEQAPFGPTALVLCSSSMKAEGLEANLKHLVATNKFANPIANRPKPESRVKIILRNGEQDPSRAALELFNGCHVLVTTPGVFKSLNEYYQGMSIQLTKLSIVVLDDADILIEKCKEEVEEILNMCQEEMSNRENQVDIQLVLTARKWHPMLEKWAVNTCLNKPVTVVSAGFELLMFGQVQPMITVVSGDSRMHQAVNFVRERHGKANILICCGENETALELGSALQAACANLIVAVNGEEKGKTSALKKKWAELSAGGKGPVLVASDDVLPSLAISDADILLHYSVPQSKYAYFLRMSSLFDSIALKQKKGPKIHIFVDVDCDEKCILTLVDFQKRAGGPIPEQVSMKAEIIRKRKEQEKSLSPLCPKVCAFGVCAEMNLCADRHVLDQTDIPAADFPKSGEVKVQVSHVHDASHFSVRVQEHKDDEGNVTEASSEQHLALAMDLDEHFSQEKSRISLKNVQFGVTCAIETKPGIFQRVRIVRIVFKNNEGEPVTVKIKSLDEGWTALKESSKLLHLPKHFRQIPPYTVDVFLCGVMPRDEETEWSKTADKFVKNWTEMMSRRMGNKQFFISGKIALSLGETLWLDPMECVQASASKDTHVKVFSFAERLIQVKVAVANKKHLQKLKQLCDEAKIALPELKKTGILASSVPMKEKVDNPADFAFLPMNEVVPVNVSFIDSPSKFFVQPACFSDLLENLSNDLCNHQNALKKAAWKDAPKEEGAFVLAKNPRNQTWSRAQIKKHSNEDVLLYFVDEGLEERVQCNHVLPLPDHLLKKLPCQAIDCSLYGVEPAMGKIWTRENVLTMLDLLLCDDSQNMTAKVVKKKKSDVTGGWHYLIRLFNEEKNFDVARALVEKDEAIFTSTEKEECWWLNDNNSGNSSDALIEFDESETELFPVEEEEGAENSVPKEVKQEEVVLNEEDFDVTIDDISNLFGEYTEFKTQLDRLKSLKKQEPKVELCKEEIARSPNKKVEKLAQIAAKPAAEKQPKSCLISTCYETHFLWSQTEEFIRIKIQLFGVDDYYLQISPSQVDFACYSQGKAYCFHLHLFGYVIPNKCSHFARGLYVELKLQKSLDMMWPRLDCMERGTIGASHTIETITVDSDNDEEPNFNLDTKMTGQERVLTDIIMPDDSLPNDFDEIADSEGGAKLKYVDRYDPLLD